jgi:hypothetical protein
MSRMIAAVITAIACAGLIVTFVPGFAPEVAAGATPIVERSVVHGTPSSATIGTVAVQIVPTASHTSMTGIRRTVEENLRNGSGSSMVVCQQSWPYYEQSCLRDGGAGDGKPRVVRVVATDRLR